MLVLRAITGLLALTLAGDPVFMEQTIKPSTVDAQVRQFDDANVVIVPKDVAVDAPLVVFLPGTHGRPQNVTDLLRVVAGQGYRVIGLAYDDDPAVVQVCPRDPDPDCSAKFREMRITGGGPGVTGMRNPPAEAIEARLVALLTALETGEPGAGWGQYREGGKPRWDRIVVSGLSQGAGMAAFIAKQHAVRRVVLFSSPWDFTLPGRKLAPWIAQPSATPPERWFAEYHAREATADLLASSYHTLRIPADHVTVFDRALAPGMNANGSNPYHGSTVRDIGYTPQWRALYGRASDR